MSESNHTDGELAAFMRSAVTPHSALGGVMDKLRRGDLLSDAAIDEIERLLYVLQGEGWSGFLPADRAALALQERIEELERQRTDAIATAARAMERSWLFEAQVRELAEALEKTANVAGQVADVFIELGGAVAIAADVADARVALDAAQREAE